MYSHTKRIGSLGRYGVKTGKKVREEMKKIEDAARLNTCPTCTKKITRKAAGVWECKFCGNKMAGGSYFPVPVKQTSVEEQK
jgi:large subunit ribosomal protein L37Ae